MNHAALKSLIDADPVLADFVASGNDAAIVAALNAFTERGEVPLAELNKLADARQVTFRLLMAEENDQVTGNVRGAVRMALQFFAARYPSANVDDATFGEMCDLLGTIGVCSADDKAAFLALAENRQSRVMKQFGQAVTDRDVSFALRSDR